MAFRRRCDARAALALMLVAGAIAAPASAQDSPVEKIHTLRVAYNPTIGQLPLFVAQDRGFFQKNGLAVKLMPGTNTPSFAPGLGRQYDIVGGTATEFIASVARGLDVVAFAAGSKDDRDHNSTALMVRGDSGIKSVKDLDGKYIAVSNLSGTIFMSLQYQIKKAGVDPANVKFVQVPFGNMADQLKAGRVQAVLGAQPFIAAMEATGAMSLGNPFLAVSDETITLLWKTSRKFADENPDVLVQWRKSLREAIQYIKVNEVDARTLLTKELKLAPNLAAHAPLSNAVVTLKASDLDPWVKLLEEVGVIKQGEIKDTSLLVIKE